MAQQIQLRRGTAAAWTAANPTLASGELGLETDTSKLKIGDGVTAWNSAAYVSADTASAIHAATSKTTPVDADELGIVDSAASNVLKKLTWANLKATAKAYFDTLYQAVLVSGTNIKTINSTSLLGSGDIPITGAAPAGSGSEIQARSNSTTFQAVTGSSISGGQITVADKLTITQATANTGVLASTGYSLTGSDASNMVDLAGTLNTSGNPIALKIALTNTASGSSSKFISLLAGAAGATEQFNVGVNGLVVSTKNGSHAYTVNISGQNPVGFGRNSSVGGFQIFDGVATTPSDSNGAALFGGGKVVLPSTAPLGWAATSLNQPIDTAFSRVGVALAGLGTGAQGSVAGDLSLRGLRFGSTLTVGTLPSASTAGDGMSYRVTDLTTPALGAAPSGSGAVHGVVTSNGTSYTVTQFG